MLRRLLTLAGLLFVTLGTTCATLLRARQPIAPAPPLDCLREALATSPDVIRVAREFRGAGTKDEGFWVVLRDSTAASGQRLVNLWRDTPGHRGRLQLSFSWPRLKRPPAREERAAAALAGRVLTHVQQSCAPDVPAPPVVCDRGDGEWTVCALSGRGDR